MSRTTMPYYLTTRSPGLFLGAEGCRAKDATTAHPRKISWRIIPLQKLIEILGDVIVLGESMAILVVAPRHGAGEMEPKHLQRMAEMIISKCKAAQGRIESLTN
jgi:hypothetical protein